MKYFHWVFLFFILINSTGQSSHALQQPKVLLGVWITQEEANLSPKIEETIKGFQHKDIEPAEGEATAGPLIKVEKPEEGNIFNGKINIEVKFKKNPLGSDVDMGTLKVVYLKIFDVDITDRIRPYIKGEALVGKNIEFPEGEHIFQIRIQDKEQIESVKTFSIIVH